MNSLLIIPIAFVAICILAVQMGAWGAAGAVLALGLLTGISKGFRPEIVGSFAIIMLAALLLGGAVALCRKGGASILAGAALGVLIALPLVGYASVTVWGILTQT